jgi:hypothetical protein
MPTRIARNYFHDARNFFKVRLGAPETPAGEGGGFCFNGHGGRRSRILGLRNCGIFCRGHCIPLPCIYRGISSPEKFTRAQKGSEYQEGDGDPFPKTPSGMVIPNRCNPVQNQHAFLIFTLQFDSPFAKLCGESTHNNRSGLTRSFLPKSRIHSCLQKYNNHQW